MSNDLVTTGGKLAWANEFAKSEMLPKHMRGNPANILYAVELAASLGLSPITAITSVHVIEGKPSASAALIGSLVRKAGHRLRVFGDDKIATAQIWRCDDPDFMFEAVWTMQRANAAGLTGKAVWRNFPAAMLQARAITEVARQACQDCLHGVQYTPEELGHDEGAQPQSKVATIADRIANAGQPARLPQPVVVTTTAGTTVQPVPAPEQEPIGWRDDQERKWFMAELGRLELDYEDVAAWRESQGKLRPSKLTPSQRKTLLTVLQDPASPSGQLLLAWLRENRVAPGEPVEEAPQDRADESGGFNPDDTEPF